MPRPTSRPRGTPRRHQLGIALGALVAGALPAQKDRADHDLSGAIELIFRGRDDHGVRIDSDHCVFLIDRTKTMDDQQQAGVTKQEAAALEFEAALGRLVDTGLSFNVALYNEELELLHKAATPLTKKAFAGALKFVRSANAEGRKNIWNALSQAVADPTVDTIILLSSGEPEVGHYVHWNRVTRHLADLNRFHKVVVHTVA
jgi:hypothetical protein